MPVADGTLVQVELDTFSRASMNDLSYSQSRVKSIPAKDQPRKLKKRDYAIGIGLLLVVVFLWTSSNFVTQVKFFCFLFVLFCLICAQDLFEGGYEKPFLYVVLYYYWLFYVRGLKKSFDRVTYLNTSAFALYLVPFLVRRTFNKRRGVKIGNELGHRTRWGVLECLISLLVADGLQYCTRVSTPC